MRQEGYMQSNTQTRILKDRLVEALIAGEHSGASLIIDEGLEQGVSVSKIYTEVLAPAQVEIGQQWHDGLINVAQEHLATQITLRQMDRLRQNIQPTAKLGLRAVVTAVEGERHFLGARMAADFLYMDGWNVDFLGEDTPTDDLVDFVKHRQAELVALSVTLVENLPHAKHAIEGLRQLWFRPKVIVGGAATVDALDVVEGLAADAIASDPLAALQQARLLTGLEAVKQSLQEYLETLGDRIQSLRKKMRWSQQELADRAGLDRTYISMVEHGKQNLTLGAVMKIADALDVPLGTLLRRETQAP